MIRSVRRVAAMACALCCAAALAGCAAPQQQQPADQKDSVAENRQYMSALNQMSDDLSERLAGFTDAVSRNDSVGMRTQADDAFQVIEKMKEQDAPEDLTELKEGYLQACEDLEDALSGYIDLYDEVAAAGSDFDYATYQDRIEQVQDAYNSAAETLEQTDQKATELQK